MKKGQYLRLFIRNSQSSTNRPVAAATNMTLHVSATTENSSTKDTTGDWDEFEVTGLAFDISSEALVINDENPNAENNIQMLMEMLDDTPLNFSIAETSGAQNRPQVSGGGICYGQVKLTSLQVTAANLQNSTMTAQFNGYGDLVVADSTANSAPSYSTSPEPTPVEPTDGGDGADPTDGE